MYAKLGDQSKYKDKWPNIYVDIMQYGSTENNYPYYTNLDLVHKSFYEVINHFVLKRESGSLMFFAKHLKLYTYVGLLTVYYLYSVYECLFISEITVLIQDRTAQYQRSSASISHS